MSDWTDMVMCPEHGDNTCDDCKNGWAELAELRRWKAAGEWLSRNCQYLKHVGHINNQWRWDIQANGRVIEGSWNEALLQAIEAAKGEEK